MDDFNRYFIIDKNVYVPIYTIRNIREKILKIKKNTRVQWYILSQIMSNSIMDDFNRYFIINKNVYDPIYTIRNIREKILKNKKNTRVQWYIFSQMMSNSIMDDFDRYFIIGENVYDPFYTIRNIREYSLENSVMAVFVVKSFGREIKTLSLWPRCQDIRLELKIGLHYSSHPCAIFLSLINWVSVVLV